MNTTTVALSNGLTAIVSAASVIISGVTIPTSHFETAKPYIDRAKSTSTSPSLEVSGYTASLVTPEPVISAAGRTFTLGDFDKVVDAIAEASKPKSVTVSLFSGYTAVVTSEGITINGQTVPADVLTNLNNAVAEVNS